MENGKMDHMSRLMKLSADVVQLAVRGKRDPIDVANKLQAIIDSPIPGTRPEWMSEGEYRHEVGWWKDWLEEHDFDTTVAKQLAPSLVLSLAYSTKPNFPAALRLPVPSLLSRSRHAIFWREFTGVRIVNAAERNWPKYQSLRESIESVYPADSNPLSDISTEMFEDQLKVLFKRFGAPKSSESVMGYDLDANESWVAMEIMNTVSDFCLTAGILMGQENVFHEFDPIMRFWAEYGNYPLGFTEEGLFVVLCADPEHVVTPGDKDDEKDEASEDALDHLEDF